MTPNSENFEGLFEWGFGTFSLVTCFTENRIGHYHSHAMKYGLMGLGFSRKWVTERDGIPAIYLKNNSTDIQTQIISQLYPILRDYKDSTGKENQKYFYSFSMLLDYVKPMSTKGIDDFKFCEESEWRIAWNNRQVESKNIRKNALTDNPKYFLPFSPKDLQLLILPDITCRKLALRDSTFQNFLQNSDNETLIVSLEELENL